MSLKNALPEYSSTGFVNREEEIALVRQRLEELLNRQRVEKRTFIFTGQHGIGKSWFLLHLRDLLQTQNGVKVQHLNLGAYPITLAPQTVLLQIIAKISHELLANTAIPYTTPDTAAAYLLTSIREKILRDHVLVILLDTVYESPRPLLTILEDYLLGPLAIENNVLMILAGRGREYPWSTPELRLQAEFHTLPLFSDGSTAAQLQRHNHAAFSRAHEIHAVSLGNPKTTLLLAENDNTVAVLDLVINEMLPREHPERALIRQHLEALAIVRGFDYSQIPHLFSVYYDQPAQKTLPRRELRVILDRLLEPGLVYWNTTKLAYTLHEAMRNLICRYLRQAKPALWCKLHASCIDLYQEWVGAKTTHSSPWQEELAYHRHELAQGDGDLG